MSKECYNGTGELGANEVQVRVERGGDEVRPGAFSSAPTCTCKYISICKCTYIYTYVCRGTGGRDDPRP